MRRILALVLGFALLATAASAQDARVNDNTPIYINPSPAPNTLPLRIAAVGTLLEVVGQDGEWLRIEFQDPQWGRRTGWTTS
jgi:hypothetical protein